MTYLDKNSTTSARSNIGVFETASFMNRVYLWMMIGIFITSVVAYQVASRPELVNAILSNKLIFIGLIVLQLGAVVMLGAVIQRLSLFVTTSIYLAYSVLTGITFSITFLAFTGESIISTFFVTAVSFGCLSAFGYITKRDLGPIGSFCMMGLFGLIAIWLLSLFIPSLMGNTAQMVMSVIGIIVFAGLTAYDTQKLKAISMMGGDAVTMRKESIRGALMLYLDFINLFLSILRLTGDRR